MANNLFVSYDLNAPGQDYEKIFNAIKSLGDWAKVQKSFWYVKSIYTAPQAVDIVWKVMDKNDSLIVVDATNKNAAWQNIDPTVSKFVQDYWSK